MKVKFESLTVNELWALHEQIAAILTSKINAEKRELEMRLARISRHGGLPADVAKNELKVARLRRPYPRVLPKFRNPLNPGETWSGRGKQPRWLTAQLKSGKKVDDFRIKSAKARSAR